MATRVAIAASNPLAAEAGLRLAEQGGNAVDAAVAAILVSTVCEPGVCSLAGGAFATVAPSDGSAPVTVDGNVEMPGRGLPAQRFGRGVREIRTDYGGGVTMTVGHGSVATPGALAALDLAHRRYGRVPWREVVRPAVEAARDGFPLRRASAYYLGYVHDSVFGWHPDSRAALHSADGAPLPEGALVHVPHLADSLELIASQGAAALHGGEVGRLVAADMTAHEGLVTGADLAAYAPVVRPALGIDMGSWHLATNPAPAIGGVVLAAMLELLGDRPRSGWSPVDVAYLVDVQEAVLRLRVEHLDITDDRVAAAAALLATVRSAERRLLPTAASTVNVSVVDDAGGACAVTASAGYGSGVMTPGTGLWLNNCLGEPELNRGGLHALPPGERLPSNMAPTVGRSDEGAALAIGSPGADRITTALVQVLAGFVNGGLGLQAAIDQPRLHVALPEGGVLVEHEEDASLPPLGRPTRSHHAQAMYFGGVGAALRRGDGALEAAGDPRRAAAVAISPA